MAGSSSGLDGPNPFSMPTDEEVFTLRDEEQQRKLAERERVKSLHVWEKGHKTSSALAVDFRKMKLESSAAAAAQQSKINLVAAATRDRRKEKENMAEFIAKKREMFLVQMSLDTKREEIRKLEEKAQMKEEALKKSEQMRGGRDALRGVPEGQRAERRAGDEEGRERDEGEGGEGAGDQEAEQPDRADQGGDVEVRGAARGLPQVQGVPRQAHAARVATSSTPSASATRALPPPPATPGRISRHPGPSAADPPRSRAGEAEGGEGGAGQEAAEEEARAAASGGGGGGGGEEEGRGRKDKEAEEEERARKIDAAVKAAIKPEDVSDDEVPEEEREMPMYFAEPQQLLDIFTALEESNPSHPKLAGDRGGARGAQGEVLDTRGRMSETAGLKVQIDSLKGSIEVEEAKGQGSPRAPAATRGCSTRRTR